MSLPKFKGIPKGIAWLSMVGVLSLMFAAPAVVTAAPAAAGDKVLVCKVVGGPGHYTLKEGKQPIEVDANALEADVQPIVGAPFSDAQPSFVVASDDRTLCEAGLPPIVVPNPNPAGSVTFVQPSCTVDHVVANITDATPPGVGPGYAGIWYYLVSSRGAESQTPDSVDRLSSFALNSQPMAFGETVTFTVKAQLDTPEGSPQLVTIDSFTATRSSSGCGPIVVTPVAPAVIDQVIVCTSDFALKTISASITPAVTKGVEYLLDGKVVTVAVLVQPGTHTFEARALEGSVLTAPMNLFLGVNAGVAPVCTKPVVVPPVVTPPVAVPPVATAPIVAKVKTAVLGPKVVTDYVSDDSTGLLGWWLSLVIGGLGMVLVSRVFPRRKVQENKH